jgi:hypothetical protein
LLQTICHGADTVKEPTTRFLQQELGIRVTPLRAKFTSRGQTSPLGANHVVKNWPQNLCTQSKKCNFFILLFVKFVYFACFVYFVRKMGLRKCCTFKWAATYVHFRWSLIAPACMQCTLSTKCLNLAQGCQMEYFNTKIPLLGNFWVSCNGRCWYILWPFGQFYGHLVNFMAIWYIL